MNKINRSEVIPYCETGSLWLEKKTATIYPRCLFRACLVWISTNYTALLTTIDTKVCFLFRFHRFRYPHTWMVCTCNPADHHLVLDPGLQKEHLMDWTRPHTPISKTKSIAALWSQIFPFVHCWLCKVLELYVSSVYW